MKKYLFWLLFGVSVGCPLPGWSENNCVTCHRGLAPSASRSHDFSEWDKSIHAQRGVTCEQCHGGHPAETDLQKAHEGIVKSNQSDSPLYFSHIPETCGKCHTAELGEFKKSYHYRELKRSGRGPNCTTCHGSMAVSILEPRQMEQSCSLCHKQRQIASEALVTLKLAATSLKTWERAFQSAQLHGGVTADQAALLNEWKQAYQGVQRKWHSFGLSLVVQRAQEIVTIAKQETQKLRLARGVNKDGHR